MTPFEIMRDLARTDIFPKAAMAAARDQRDVMAPIFVDLIARLAAQDQSAMRDDDVTALIPVFHMLGEFREPRAYRPVLQLLRQDSVTLEYLLGDAVTETSFRVVAGTFDGDLQPVFDTIEDPGADEFARSCMMDALVLIAQIHPEKRSEVDDYFRQFLSRCPDDESDVLVGWVDGLSNLGLEDMEGEIRSVFEAGLIPEDYCDVSEILDDLPASAGAGGAPVNPRYRHSLITDAIEELSKWHCFSNEFLARHVLREDNLHAPVEPWTETFRNTTPKVGRNEPCPCGSGRKFKKCCLH